MAVIVKKVDRAIPSVERSQVFTQEDAVTGDVLDFKTSLGRAAKSVRIETAGSSNLSVVKNSVHTVFPLRTGDDKYATNLNPPYENLTQGVEIVDATMRAETVGTSLDLTGPVKDLRVTWTTGTWTIVAE